MTRYILRYLGAGELPSEDVARFQALDDTHVVDRSARMLLVEAPGDDLQRLTETMPQWAVAPEQITPLPDARPRVRKMR